MSEAAADHPPAPHAPVPDLPAEHPTPGANRRALRLGALALLVMAILLTALWIGRERLADQVIASQLRALDLPATYRIERIGPREQVLRDIVIGDPRHPDLTIERAEIAVVPRWGLPGIGRVTLDRPRLYGTWRGRSVSFGSLDRVLFGGQRSQPFRLPDLDLTVLDGRGRVLGDHGAIGFVFDGTGGLRDGFSGTLAAIAPRLGANGCAATRASLFGRLGIRAERPTFDGPLRAATLDCGETGGLELSEVGVRVVGTLDPDLSGGAARLGLGAGPTRLASVRANGWNGTIDATYRNQNLTARYDLLARSPSHPQAGAATLSLSGLLRARGGLGRFDSDGTLDAGGLHTGAALGTTLAAYERQAAGTLAAPLLGQVRAALAREARGSRLRADFVVRRTAQGISLVFPQARLSGGSGATLLALSRLHFATTPGLPRLAGNFSTGGAGLPAITGRLEQGSLGQTQVHMAMADYAAGEARLAVPRLDVLQQRDGALTFAGLAVASGPLPGGQALNLAVPLDGARSARGDLALWRRCTTVRFDALTLSSLTLDRRALALCPVAGGAMVSATSAGLKVEIGTTALDLTGRLGETPVHITSGPAGYAAPGALFASALDVVLGPPDTATRLRLTDLRAQVGDAIAGTFAGADARLFAVPLDLLDAAGQWRYADGRLTIEGATLRLEDRSQVDRFNPLRVAQGTLYLEDNRITSSALLKEPSTGRDVARVAISHDLGSGTGHADLTVGGLVFDRALQPDMLSRTLLGVVANVQGTVRGDGRIAWTPSRVSSSGRFRSDGLDLAAAFGPVKGLAGEVVFTDLLGLETAPHQRLAVASINPGIEVTDGAVLFQLKPDAVVAIEGGEWPFLGGRLLLRPATMRFGVAETRRFVLDIEALDAARFLAQMELANLSATGTFDGSLPLVFDENGGRIDAGLLVSRPPGGNVSYVGALTYKDLSAVANFAFDALKSLDYKVMRIAMDGALEGDIVTRVRFDGVKQGIAAKRNFITRRFASLPLQFNVNVRAPFYGLISSFKAMYDPAYIKDPRTLGLLDAQGRPVRAVPPPGSADKRIQPPVIEKTP